MRPDWSGVVFRVAGGALEAGGEEEAEGRGGFEIGVEEQKVLMRGQPPGIRGEITGANVQGHLRAGLSAIAFPEFTAVHTVIGTEEDSVPEQGEPAPVREEWQDAVRRTSGRSGKSSARE